MCKTHSHYVCHVIGHPHPTPGTLLRNQCFRASHTATAPPSVQYSIRTLPRPPDPSYIAPAGDFAISIATAIAITVRPRSLCLCPGLLHERAPDCNRFLSALCMLLHRNCFIWCPISYPYQTALPPLAPSLPIGCHTLRTCNLSCV